MSFADEVRNNYKPRPNSKDPDVYRNTAKRIVAVVKERLMERSQQGRVDYKGLLRKKVVETAIDVTISSGHPVVGYLWGLEAPNIIEYYKVYAETERLCKQEGIHIKCRPSNSEQVFSSDYSEPFLQCE